MLFRSLAAQLASGKLVPLAVADRRRHAAVPDTPSFAELGYPELEFRSWSALLAPAGTPPDIIRRLNAEIAGALRASDIVARFAAMQLDAASGTPQELREVFTRESAMWKPLIAGLGLAQD